MMISGDYREMAEVRRALRVAQAALRARVDADGLGVDQERLRLVGCLLETINGAEREAEDRWAA